MPHNTKLQDKPFKLSLESFLPGGDWDDQAVKDNEGNVRKWYGSDRPEFAQDSLSGDIYWNQPNDHLRLKLSLLTGLLAGVVGGNAISLTINAGYRALKIASFSHFWLPMSKIDPNKNDGSYHFLIRLAAFAKDLARIIATPFAYIALLFTSLLGSIMPTKNGPKDAMKIFSSIEIAMYGGLCGEGAFKKNGHFCWAPCYQPHPTSHGLGGDIKDERAF